MATLIQISIVDWEHIEDDEQVAELEALVDSPESFTRNRNFVTIDDGDESLIRSCGILDEEFTPEQVADFVLDGEHDDINEVVIDPDIDGVSDFLEMAGFEIVTPYWSSHQTYRRN